MSEIKVAKITPRVTNGDIALAESGDTVTLGTGAQFISGGDIVVPSGGSLTINSGATVTNNGTNGGGFGKVLQVAQGTQSNAVSTTGTTFVTSNLSASITPSSTSNKILVLVHINSFYAEGTNAGGYIALYRGGSVLVNNADRIYGSGDSLGPAVVTHLDSPSSTSPLTYEIYFRKASGNSVACHNGGEQSNIILMEIAG